MLTPLPWYLISLACAFYYYGREVIIVWDDTVSDFAMNKWCQRFQQNSIRRVMQRIPNFIKCVPLSTYGAQKMSPSSYRVDHLLRKNKTIYYRGEVYPPGSKSFERKVRRRLEETSNHVQSFLQDVRPSYVLIGGGGYGSSGLWIDLAGAMNIRVASIDSGFSILLLSADGIAANLDDIERAFKLLPEEDDSWITPEAQEELKKRMHGDDQFISQIVQSTGGDSEFGVLLPLNQSYDLSALERHRVFKSQTEWMLETIQWVIQNSTERIVIRRHPVERFPQFKSNDDYLKLIKNIFGSNDRICFVDSNAAINTYDLIEKAKVVVTYVSTVGIEAAAAGRVVVTEGNSCYADLGFVWGAKNREQYFEFINAALKGELKVTEKQRNDAWRCYYLTQCCNWHHTIFTPQATDFDKWVFEDPEKLLTNQEVLDIITAIEQNIPLSILAHHKKKKAIVENT
jgi:hypothetical protein